LLASCVAIVATYAALRFGLRRELRQAIASNVPVPQLTAGGKTAAAGIVATAGVLLVASAMDIQLGLPTCVAGAATAAIVLIRRPSQSWDAVKDVSWGVLPLVAGLFVLVEALDRTGVIAVISALLREAAVHSAAAAAWAAGVVVAVTSNFANNLPVALIAGSAVQSDQTVDQMTRAILIGVDLGPNLSVTGSLATILWLTALRREGHKVSAVAFLQLGLIVMPPALVLALAASFLAR
ncbi:MAG: ArsB/NhaD family transporter, partial [Xanthobacteraceae bacterium]